MSGFLPADTSLQLGDNSGNIFHQGNLISNVNGTSLLSSTFPTTSTGNSTAHAHYTDASTNALKFLNASANGQGGHQFWLSTSSSAPIKTAQFDISGLTIKRDTTITNYNTYSTTITTPTFIIMDYNPQNAPTNWVLGQMYIMRVGNTTATMSIGVDYNVKYIDTQAVRVYTTSSDTSPVIDSSGITSVLLPYSTSGAITTSVLSSNDLTFNSVSLPSQVSQNTLDISQNRTDISRNTLNIAQNTLDISQNRTDISKNKIDISLNTNNINTLTIKQTNLIYQFSSPAIYADGSPPLPTPTTIINSYAINAWYFKNLIAGQKINWYIPTTSDLKVQDILGLYLRLFNVSTISNDNTIFLTVYTTPDAGPNYSWYKSKMTYILNQSITPTINTLYTFFMNASGTCPNPSSYASSLVNMQISPVQNPRGAYGPTENIMFFSIGSNSASAVNSVEVVVQKFGVMTPTGTQEFQFAPLL